MWKQVLETLWQSLRLAEDLQQNRQDIKALEKRLLDFAAATERELYELRRANERLVYEVQRLTDELKRQREHEESERRILKLELENYLLRQGRSLPPAKPQPPTETETDNQTRLCPFS